MKIWVDADACPVAIKEILFKAALRTKTETTFVANHSFRLPAHRFVNLMQVEKGFDIADNEIVRRVEANDLVITSDIPLAAEVIEKNALVLTPRGDVLDKQNVRQRLNIRDFMDTMRSSGVQTGGPSAMNQKDKQNFANFLDSTLRRVKG
ncbi:YaiI/YqxD family protein [Alteromonas sp. ASW11-130]|uniref:YaiI/YqxD family protein n=1 Tax=Alteromonas sp. ASW11-130 TaxID=3015775 RepID=UPI002241E8A8|nr:YaiI/YqxD family protein [Alteromonas sp. ASW11-130]MCW8092207.1 YaiI/YqxD family protein [Alteromonas sp. ASW11-130]